MMNSQSCIEQKGIVESSGNGIVSVKIYQISACSDCNAKASCSLFGVGEKIIDVHDEKGVFRAGDRVGVTITQSVGTKAIILGYFLPFILLIATLVLFTLLRFREWQAGLLAMASLIPYYLIIYIFRSKLKKTFTFTLKRLNEVL